MEFSGENVSGKVFVYVQLFLPLSIIGAIIFSGDSLLQSYIKQQVYSFKPII